MDEPRHSWSTSASLWDSRSQATDASRSNMETNEFFASMPGSNDITLQPLIYDKTGSQSTQIPFRTTRGEARIDDAQKLAGKPWKAGAWARFPCLSFFCLLVILTAMAGLVAVLLASDGKPIASWDTANVQIAGHKERWKVSVSAWISLLSFTMSQALTVMFAEAVATSWWVDALKGQTLSRLHHKWAVRESVWSVFRQWRLWGWVCVASLAFTTFAGLEALLQTASSTTTALSSHDMNTTVKMANALPAGFSGVIAAIGHDSFGTVYYTPVFTQVLQNYTAQSSISLDVENCPSTSNASCSVTLPGVGFQYTCEAGRGNATFFGGGVGPQTTVFNVDIEDQGWELTLNVSWKDTPGDGMVLATRLCTLTPALVEYRANVSQNIVTLEPPTSNVDWTSNSTDINGTLVADKVLHLLPELQYDKNQSANVLRVPGTHSTTGGLGLGLNTLFQSSITIQYDATNDGARTNIKGSFVASYAQFEKGTSNSDIDNNTFSSPMDQLMSDIRNIMFRSSVAIAQQNVSDYELVSTGSAADQAGTNVPVEAFTREGNAQVFETVYKTNRVTLGVGISLMLVALLAIFPLYWGFWRLGRDVSMSPLEIAKALHYSTIVNPETDREEPYSVLDVRGHPDKLPQYGSNFSANELVKLLGERKVKYGEVQPNVLGIGLSEHTNAAWRDRHYH